jgi:hypothetical protein
VAQNSGIEIRLPVLVRSRNLTRPTD